MAHDNVECNSRTGLILEEHMEFVSGCQQRWGWLCNSQYQQQLTNSADVTAISIENSTSPANRQVRYDDPGDRLGTLTREQRVETVQVMSEPTEHSAHLTPVNDDDDDDGDDGHGDDEDDHV